MSHALALPLGTRFPLLQPLGEQAFAQASQQGPPVGRLGSQGQVQLQARSIGPLGLGAEPELKRRLAQQAQLGRTQAIAFLKRFTHKATVQEAIDEGGKLPSLQQ